MLLIPAIDLRNGRCVRLFQGNFAAETRYEVEPEELLARYRSFGASWLHVVDLDGARDGVSANREVIIGRLATQNGIRLQVGGGMRSASAIDDLLRNGVQRVVVGSAAVERPEETASWLTRFGSDRVCLAFDVRLDSGGEARVQTRGWTASTPLTLWRAIESYGAGLLRHVLCTDIDRDGALTGPSLELYREAVRRYPHIAWQASGGIRSAADLLALEEIGVAAAISGKALLEQRITPEELRPFLPDASSPALTSATARS